MTTNEIWAKINCAAEWTDIHSLPQYGIRVEYKRTNLAFIRFILVEGLGTKIQWWWQERQGTTAQHGETSKWDCEIPQALIDRI